MKRRRLRSAILAVALTLDAMSSAQAVEYLRANEAASQVAFTYTQMGVRMYGTFGKFDVRIAFDPANPTASHTEFTIQVASIDAGSSEANQELQKPEWFNTARYPVARFESSSVTSLGDNRYEVAGKLTIKGQTRDLRTPVSFKPQGGIGVFYGELVVKRTDFNLGEGLWADLGVIANDVHIKFRIVAPEQ